VNFISESWSNAALALSILVAAAVAVLIIHYVLVKLLGSISKKSTIIPTGSLRKHLRKPLKWTLIVIAIRIILPVFGLADKPDGAIRHILTLLLIGLFCWLLIKLAYILQDCVLGRFDIAVKDNIKARKIHTQLKVITQIITIAALVLAAGMMLMTFPAVRQFGTTILASAGIIGIVVGMAAQRTIGTFIAGLQLAFTQPIRLDDVVIVENQWGRIEEITLTYVVVKIWDLRRLVVPITYFIEKPFQNWTRTSSNLLTTVYLYVDYSVPVEAVRKELQNIVKDNQLWDGELSLLQVTNTTEQTIELRALVSASDASKAWDLKCQVREKLISFIQNNYPSGLPKVRAELKNLPVEANKHQNS